MAYSFDWGNKYAGSVDIQLIEGEILTACWTEGEYMYIMSSLGRKWKSTNTVVNRIDFMEEEP